MRSLNMSLYIVDTANKNLKPLDGTKLSEQKFKERDDLQEWFVSHPEALGEELLIIQKEFEPYRVCRRVNILRDYPDDKIKIYP